MKSFFKTLLKHPVSVICYSIYTWLCYKVLSSRFEFNRWAKAHPAHSISYGEGIAYMALCLVIIGAIFGLVLLINALIRKKVVFYVWMIIIIFVQTMMALNIQLP